MSAIAGIVCLNGNDRVSKEELVPMLEAMRPSLPSKVETCVAPECSAVLGRVAYGPDAGNVSKKTISSNMPQVFLVGDLYNDEIVQYDSPGDFLLERYRQRKVENFAVGLNGSFTAAIVDGPNQSITLVTDHTASHGLFTFTHAGRFYFASEVKGLLAMPEVPGRPDLLAVLSLAARGFFVARRTLAENVDQMDYATVCEIRDGKVRSWPYWRYLIQPEKDRGRKTYITELADLLRQGVQRMVRTGKCAILLSGGFDSRGILACMNEPRKIQAITHTQRTKQTRHRLGDWVLAEKVAERLGMKFSAFHVDCHDFIAALRDSVYCSDGAAGFIAENVCDRIREETGLEYVLVGDECMGYTTGLTSNARVLPSVHIHSIKRLSGLQSVLRKDRLELFIEQSEAELRAITDKCCVNTPCDRADELYFQQRLIHFLNPKRRVLMRHGLCVRSPWLDLDILNFIRKVPTRYRIGKKLFRDTLFYINPGLFELPRARENETVNYHAALSKSERERKGISEIIFHDNPLLEEFFDISSVQTLIEEVCLSETPVQTQVRFNPLTLMPMGLRLRLGALHHYLMNPAPRIGNVYLLLMVMTVAETLRQLKNRFADKSILAGT